MPMYDPKFSQKQMYDQYGSSRKTTTTNANTTTSGNTNTNSSGSNGIENIHSKSVLAFQLAPGDMFRAQGHLLTPSEL